MTLGRLNYRGQLLAGSIAVTDLDVPSLLDRLDELVLAGEVRPGQGRQDHVDLPHGGDEPRVVVERRLHQARPFGLEGQQRLELVDVDADLRPHQDERRVALRQARRDEPTADEARAAHHKNLALLHAVAGRCPSFLYWL